MKCRLANLDIAGIAASVPSNTLNLLDLASEYGANEVQRIMQTTGIETVRVAPPTMTTADLCEAAALQLLRQLEVKPEQVDGIVFVSQTPDYILPATSVCLQHRLGMSTDVTAFDLSYGCSGYIYGLFQAALLIHSGACQLVMLCAGDTITRYAHPRDRSVRMVFGDAGSATLMRRGTGTACFTLHSDGAGAEHLIVPAGGCRLPQSERTSLDVKDEQGNVRSAENIYMNSMELMKFSVREVPNIIEETLTLGGWTKDSVGFYGLHQTSKFMVNYLARISGLPEGSAPVAMGRTGNTGPASIPLLLAGVRNDFPPERRSRSILCGYGVGYSWGACAADLGSTVVLPPIELPAKGSEREQGPAKMARSRRFLASTAPVAGNEDPLLGQRLSLATKDSLFETWLGPDSPALLKDHRVFDHAVFPASGFIEMAFAAGKRAFDALELLITDLVIGQALVLPEQGIRTQTVLVANPAQGFEFRISSHSEQNGAPERAGWRLHATGKISSRGGKASVPKEDLPQLREGFPEEFPVDACYSQFREFRGLDYGSSFRSIDQLFLNPDESLGHVRLATGLEHDAYLFHPVLLDGAIQVLLMSFPEGARQEAYLPVGFESFRLYRQPGQSAWAHAQLRPAEGPDQEILTGDARVFDETGEIVFELSGVSFKRGLRESVLRRTRSDLTTTQSSTAESGTQRWETPLPVLTRDFIEQLRKATDDDRPGLLKPYVHQLVSSVLKLRTQDVDSGTYLNKMGLDSLMALELRNHISTDLEVDVSMVKFLQNLSVDSMTGLLNVEFSTPCVSSGSSAPTNGSAAAHGKPPESEFIVSGEL
jgi:3-oxoacyl-[acyl-carrier-protein] synthase-3